MPGSSLCYTKTMPNIRQLTVKIMVSPLQWGEQPGNVRFTLFTTSEKLPIGSLSLGGMGAHRLLERIAADGALSAQVLANGTRFVLTHLLADDGWVSWMEALVAAEKPVASVLVDEVSLLDESRGVPNRSIPARINQGAKA